MQVLDFGEYKLDWGRAIVPTPGALGACQAICRVHFKEAGIDEIEDLENPTDADNARSQIAIKNILDDKDFLQIIDEIFNVGDAKLVGDESFKTRLNVPLSQVLNAPVLDGSGIDIKKLHGLRAAIVNFLPVG